MEILAHEVVEELDEDVDAGRSRFAVGHGEDEHEYAEAGANQEFQLEIPRVDFHGIVDNIVHYTADASGKIKNASRPCLL